MHRKTRLAAILATFFVTFFVMGPLIAQQEPVGKPTDIYFVRHGETDNQRGVRVLSPAGRQRSQALVETLKGVGLTHVFASHTTRTREMVEPLAAEQHLMVMQLPKPGTLFKGKPVSDSTSTDAAIEPLTDALAHLPPGSQAVVGVNRENAFAVMNRLGVPVKRPCAAGTTCVPCANASCFPGNPEGDFNHLWTLTLEPGAPPQLTERRYGG